MAKFKEEELWISKGDARIFGILSTPLDGKEKHSLVVISHGFGGSHEGGIHFAKVFAENGFACYNFDFCGGAPNSRSDGNVLEMSVLTEAADLEAILDYFVQCDCIDTSRIFLFGRSQGGFVSAYVAAERRNQIKAMILFYPAFVIQDDARARAFEDGTFPETCVALGMEIGRKYGEDAVSFDIYEKIGNYTGDVLILHGTEDDIVPVHYSQRALEIYPAAELILLENQGHGFTGQGLEDATAASVEFLRRH